VGFVGALFDRIFGGRSRALTLARSAELRGDLRRAEALFERAGRPDEVGRVRKMRALMLVATAVGVPVTHANRQALVRAGAELESLGEFARAAEAYALALDVDAQAGALAKAGEIERLDELLETTQARDHASRAQKSAHEEFDRLVTEGRRRDAVAMARASSDEALRARGRELYARRVKPGAPVTAVVLGQRMRLVLGDRVVLGRAPGSAGADGPGGAITIPSAALSRRHLAIARRDDELRVADLGSHNGTQLDGHPLAADTPVGSGIALRLGGEVSLALRPTDDLPGALAIVVAGSSRYVAPLGPARLGIGAWRLECVGAPGVEDWVELATDDGSPAFARGLRLADRVALLVGDAIGTDAGGGVAIRFEE
jgi:tetratricopeptide (TPR) repeat protein